MDPNELSAANGNVVGRENLIKVKFSTLHSTLDAREEGKKQQRTN